MMKVLTVGGGGREHAIVEAFHRAGSEIFAVMKNANPGILDRASKYKLVDETKVDEVCAFDVKHRSQLGVMLNAQQPYR